MVTTKIFCLMSALLLTYNSLAHAQDGPARRGFWMDVALGDGLAHLSSDTLAGQNRNGMDFIWDLGWTLSSRVRAGIGVDQWTSRWGAGKQTWLTSFNLSVYYYPLAHRTLFLQAAPAGRTIRWFTFPGSFLGQIVPTLCTCRAVRGGQWLQQAGTLDLGEGFHSGRAFRTPTAHPDASTLPTVLS